MVTEDDLIAALLETQVSDDNPHGARTVGEIMALMNWSRTRVLQRLHELHASGRLGVARIMRPALDGRMAPTSAYYVTEAADD